MIRKIAIDIGKDNIRIAIDEKGIKVNDKCLLVIDNITKKIIAKGQDAYLMLEKISDRYKIIIPVEKGVISDFNVMEELITTYFKENGLSSNFLRPIIYISYPVNASDVIKTVYQDLGESLGAKKVVLISDVIASSIGIGLDIESNHASLIVNIGSSLTNMALISLNEVIVSKTLEVAGSKFNETIMQYFKTKYQLLIGEQTIENIKLNLTEEKQQIKGRHLLTGLPTTEEITNSEILKCLEEDLLVIVNEIKKLLERVSPEVAGDIFDKGLILTGGSARLVGLVAFLKKELLIPVLIAENADIASIEGLIKIMNNSNLRKK